MSLHDTVYIPETEKCLVWHQRVVNKTETVGYITHSILAPSPIWILAVHVERCHRSISVKCRRDFWKRWTIDGISWIPFSTIERRVLLSHL